jgi:hypothetical protein
MKRSVIKARTVQAAEDQAAALAALQAQLDQIETKLDEVLGKDAGTKPAKAAKASTPAEKK